MMRYKRPALASMGYEKIRWELEEILEACEEVCYYNHDRYYSMEDEIYCQRLMAMKQRNGNSG